ncbi:MAG: hypothetical protein HY862_16795 [Chloroflexi bacterium]|nr:hypothetical protein [Chloroflexota bacterium]
MMGLVGISTEKYVFTLSRALTVSDLHSAYKPLIVEAIDLELCGTNDYAEYFCVSVANPSEIQLVVIQCFGSHGNIFNPAILYVPETDLLFIGAGKRISSFHLNPYTKLWLDTADMGFLSWARYGEFVVMSAELELVAWRINGEKLWTTFVEPPWDYTVLDRQINLDVMGNKTTFSLEEGPTV